MTDDHAVAVGRIDPHVVMVAAGGARPALSGERLTAVERHAVAGGQEVGFVFIVGRDEDVRVVMRATHGVAVVTDHPPRPAAVFRSPHLPAIGFPAFPGNAVAGLDHRVDAVGIRRRDRHLDLADFARRQPLPAQLRPGRAAVVRREEAAAGAATLAGPGLDIHVPHAREQLARVGGIHVELGTAGVLVDKQHALPVLAAVHGAIDAALLLRSVGMAQRARQHHVRVLRVHDDLADAAGLLQAHARPRASRVGGLVDAFTNRDVTADAGFTGACPHRARV